MHRVHAIKLNYAILVLLIMLLMFIPLWEASATSTHSFGHKPDVVCCLELHILLLFNHVLFQFSSVGPHHPVPSPVPR